MSFSFNFSSQQEQLKKETSSRISEPGIYLVTLKSAETGEGKTGSFYVDFVFEEKSTGNIHNHRIWAPDPNNSYPRDGETEQDAFNRVSSDRAGQLVQIATPHLPGGKLNLVTNIFEDFVNGVVAKIKNALGKVDLNLKLILDGNKEYVRVPLYGLFVERYVEGGKSNLYFSNWEKENALKRDKAPETTISNESSVDAFKTPF